MSALDAERLAAALPVPPVVLIETGSTNQDLRALAAGGAAHGTTVLADHQIAGRGRLGRSWVSPPGACLLLSVLVRGRPEHPLPASKAPLLCLAAALATAEAAGDPYRIKWPNDVLAPDGRKVAGILAEAEWDGAGGVAWAVIGIGLNVSAAPQLPAATSLVELDGQPRDRTDLAIDLITRLLRYAERVASAPADVLAAWRRRSATLGRDVRIGEVEGTAVDVDPDGALRVRTADGTERRILAGDVHMISRETS